MASATRPVTLDLTGRGPVPDVDVGGLEAALEAARRPPHPVLTLEDELGWMLRIEGTGDVLVADVRRFEGGRVQWSVIGLLAEAGPIVPLTLPGRIRRLRPEERLSPERALEVAIAFLRSTELPRGLSARAFDGEEGDMVVLAGSDRDPRPVGGWPEVERYAAGLGPARSGLALSRPDRHLVGVLGDGAHFRVRSRVSRGPTVDERAIRRREPDPTTVAMETGGAARRDEILDRSELLAVLESLYRWEEAPPGFARRSVSP